jgi:tRNA pseudouridine38-40 synthase
LKIKLSISYDGSKYFGSQIQSKKDTVHGKIKLVLQTLGINSKIAFAGRTDKGVHATQQILSFDLPLYWTNLQKLEDKLINYLPSSIKVKYIHKVNNNFHARFSAKKRSYRYIISKKPLNAFNNSYLAYFSNIDEKLIQEACKQFIGIHDFDFFHKIGSEPSSMIREIYDIKFYAYKNYYIFKFTANSYLRSQIRMMIYAIMQVSSKNLSLEDLSLQINKQKQSTNNLVNANALYLSRIYY